MCWVADVYFVAQQGQSVANWGAIAAVAASVAAIASVASAVAAVKVARTAVQSMRVQDQNARTTLSMTLLQQLVTTYDSEYMRKRRKAAAQALENQSNAKGGLALESQDVADVLNFFEGVGALVERDALEEYFAYLEFEDKLYGYWHAAERHSVIATQRLLNPQSLVNMEALYKRVLAVDRQVAKEHGNTHPKASYSATEWEALANRVLKSEAVL